MGVKKHKHPDSLSVFFATEMWERYGFYVIQTLLALYLTLHFKWPDERVYMLIGSFTALTYISPVLGGWIADHLIGQKRATLLGGFFLLLSYITLSLSLTDKILPLALAGIAVGTGLLKSNISSLLGNQYAKHSASRDRGFTIFYMGITTGIILGTTLPSYLNRHFGWSVSFVSAAIGIFIGMLVFGYGIYRYKIRDYLPYAFCLSKSIKALLLILCLGIGSICILNYPVLADAVFLGVALWSLAYIAYYMAKEPQKQAYKTFVILLLCIISVMFWAFYFQMFMSLTLFIARVVEPKVFGMPFPPPYYVAVQSIGMVLIGLFLARDKVKRPSRERAIRAGNKFALSMIVMTCAYGLIVLITEVSLRSHGLLSPFWVMPAYLLISLAELLLSPVGLSAVTLLSDRKRVSTMMGIFFVSLGMGGFLSGKFAKFTAIPKTQINLTEVKLGYASSFHTLFMILLAMMFCCLILNLLIKYLMKRAEGV